MAKEIERKYLVSNPPANLRQYKSFAIQQGYLEVKPNGDSKRVRRKGDKYFYTEKSGELLVRNEEEREITKEVFDILWEETGERHIFKERFNIPYLGKIIELDIYAGNLDGLITAEIEFKTEQESFNFPVPDWFSSEVTFDVRYRNKNLAEYGIPKDNPKLP